MCKNISSNKSFPVQFGQQFKTLLNVPLSRQITNVKGLSGATVGIMYIMLISLRKLECWGYLAVTEFGR